MVEPELRGDKKLVLKDVLIFMVSRTGELVGIPKTPDPPTVGLFGKKRNGKTLVMVRLITGIKAYNDEDHIFVANDYTSESLGWSESQNFGPFRKNLIKIGETPSRFPFVYVYPNNKDLEIPKNAPNCVKYGLPFKDFIENMHNFIDLKRSGHYLKNVADKIINLKNKDVDSVLEVLEKIPSKEMPRESKRMIMSIIQSFFREKLLDVEKGTYGEVLLKDNKLNEGKYDLISALSYADYIPVFMTSSIQRKEYLQMYFANVLNNIFRNQERGYSKKYRKVMHIFIDELSAIVDKEDKNSPCRKIIDEVVAQGGPLRTALYYATQNPSRIPRKIISNTKYIICFNLDKDEVDAIGKTLKLTKEEKETIIMLKKFEVVAKTTDEKFVFINPKTGKWYEESGTVVGKILPPLCSTRPPSGGGR